jgi:transcriptional regulator GlxA family with amidase domain
MSHFTRAFLRSLGMTPYAPAEHAQDLMLITQCPLSEIALKCGFSGPVALFVMFQRTIGTSRKQMAPFLSLRLPPPLSRRKARVVWNLTA